MDGYRWTTLPQFPDYSVSRFGDVLSHRSGKCLSPYFIKSYPAVSLHSGGRRKVAKVHALIAEAFHGPRPANLQCAHLDGDPTNNAADNLAWVTKKENEAHKRLHGTATIGDRSPHAKLTNEQAALVRKAVKSPLTRREVAVLAGVSEGIVEGVLDLGRYEQG